MRTTTIARIIFVDRFKATSVDVAYRTENQPKSYPARRTNNRRAVGSVTTGRKLPAVEGSVFKIGGAVEYRFVEAGIAGQMSVFKISGSVETCVVKIDAFVKFGVFKIGVLIETGFPEGDCFLKTRVFKIAGFRKPGVCEIG